jgi:hypothetical protein
MLSDSNGISINAGGELQGMHEAIIHFVKILKVDIFGCMAGIASCDLMMRRTVPAFVLVTHNVTIHTGLRVIL